MRAIRNRARRIKRAAKRLNIKLHNDLKKLRRDHSSVMMFANAEMVKLETIRNAGFFSRLAFVFRRGEIARSAEPATLGVIVGV